MRFVFVAGGADDDHLGDGVENLCNGHFYDGYGVVGDDNVGHDHVHNDDDDIGDDIHNLRMIMFPDTDEVEGSGVDTDVDGIGDDPVDDDDVDVGDIGGDGGDEDADDVGNGIDDVDGRGDGRVVGDVNKYEAANGDNDNVAENHGVGGLGADHVDGNVGDGGGGGDVDGL